MKRWLPPLCLLCACSPFTEVTPDGSHGPEAGIYNDAFVLGGYGPGPHGALPSGYCCTTSDECRFRSCQAFGGSMMCMDPCSTDDACAGWVPELHCNQAEGRCEPKSAQTACTPAAQFPRGSRHLGACCLATHDGGAGFECESNRCSSFYDGNPYICTQICATTIDCPGAYICGATGYGYGICVPEAKTYTCTPFL